MEEGCRRDGGRELRKGQRDTVRRELERVADCRFDSFRFAA